MRAENRKKGNIFIINTGIVILLVFLLLVGTFFFMRGLRQKSVKQAEYTLHTVSQQSAAAISVTLQEKMNNLTSIWRSFGSYEDAQREQKLLRVQEMQDIYFFQYVGYIDEHGAAFTSEGERKDLSGESWFQKSLAGESCIVKRMLDGGESVVLSMPAQSAGQPISGVLYQVFSMDEFRRLLDNKAFDGQMLFCLMESDGSVVMGTEGVVYASETNVFTSLQDRGETNRAFVEQIKKDAAAGVSGSGSYTVEAGERICCYTPIRLEGTDELWFFVSILPQPVMDAYSEEILESVYRLAAVIAAFCVLLGVQLYLSQRRQMRAFRTAAYEDNLTGRDNYFAFRQKFEARRVREGCFVSFDLMDFKYINKNYGAVKGNEVLREIGRLFAEAVQGDELTAHVSDDLYVFFFPGMKPEDAPRKCMALKERVDALLRELDVKGPAPVFGVCAVENEALDMERYRSRSMFARKSAKLRRESYAVYDTSQAGREIETVLMLSRFDEALQKKQFEIWYQPKYSLKEGRVCGAEALVRWRMEDGALLLPGRFIPLLEERGVIDQLDKYVFREVCRQQKEWLAQGLNILPVSVNLARKSLLHSDTIKEYRSMLEEAGLDAGWVWLEITEDLVDESVLPSIRALRREGFHLLMDDFGRGSSNLASVCSDCFEGVKLDKSLSDLLEDPKGETLLRHTVHMMREMGLAVTAEGVETREQAEFLNSLDCDTVQGYYFCRPIGREEYAKMLETPGIQTGLR